MPYKDPDKQREAERNSKRRSRQGGGLEHLAEKLKQVADLPDPPPREDLLKVLGAQAVEGNISAIRILLEEYRRDGNSDSQTESTLAVVHEIAEARRAQS